MILSNTDIKKYIEKEKIVIYPYRVEDVCPASYSFRLGENLLRPYGNDTIDFKRNILPEYEEITIGEVGYTLNPGEFILGQTMEKLTLNNKLAMIIEGRSALARCGIETVQTSAFIEPDHTNSIITLEIKNNGKSPFVLYPKMRFCKGVFYVLNSKSSLKGSRASYNKQQEVKPPKTDGYID